MRNETAAPMHRRVIELLGTRPGDHILHVGVGGPNPELPFPSEAFDRVLAVNAVHFWPVLERGLVEIRRVLKVGGTLAVGYRPTALIRRRDAMPPEFKAISDEELLEALGNTGFEVVALEVGDANGPGYGCAVALATYS